jgi:hypothetical protein
MIRFLSVAPDGTTQSHQLPLEFAKLVADGLRERGHRIVWYPVPPAALEPAGPTKAERRSAAREQRRQFLELGVPA